ncbi:flavin reductase family protein [Nanoarchaeota archaeon]
MTQIFNPRQVILVSSRAETDVMGKIEVKDNLFTLSWHMPVSFDPPLYAFSTGKSRFSTELIQKSKVFVVNFLSSDHEDAAVFCGSHTGKHMDKFKECDLEKKEADTVDCPVIEGASYIECSVVDEIEAGDHIIIIGKINKSVDLSLKDRLFQLPSRGGYQFGGL